MPHPRNWKKQLCSVWPWWDAAIEDARRSGQGLPALRMPNLRKNEPLIAYAPAWVSFERGLGTFTRFALTRYLHLPSHLPGTPVHDIREVESLKREHWLARIDAYSARCATLMRQRLSDFDTQLRNIVEKDAGSPSPYELASELLAFIGDDELWGALAATANYWINLRKQTDALPVTGSELRNRRFAGVTGVSDFLVYLNTGKVPVWQPRHPDELGHLRVQTPGLKGFAHKVPYFRSAKRKVVIDALAQHLADSPAQDGLQVSCLWSAIEPHGLIAACHRVIRRYSGFCAQKGWRRLEVIYIPVGLDTKVPHVSRKAVVRDLFRKVCVGRPNPRTRRIERRPLPKSVTGEQLDVAIGAIRDVLSVTPVLLIFGVHEVVPDITERAISAETLDSPLPYILDRLMPETGSLERLIPPEDAFATRALILSDGPLEGLSTFSVHNFELPPCSAESFPKLLAWTAYPRINALYASGQLPDIESNEIELSVVESSLWMEDSMDDSVGPDSLSGKVLATLRGPAAVAVGGGRIGQILRLILDHIDEHAHRDPAYVWFVTILQIVCLCPGGARRETIARILAGYVVATSSSEEALRPQWVRSREIALWCPAHARERLSQEEVDALCKKVDEHIAQFEAAVGEHIRILTNSRGAAFGEAAHPFESPEVPTFTCDSKNSQHVVQIRYPYVQRELREQLAKRCPQKHALLQRLIADEFIRRAAIVQRHGTDRDQLSLVEKRYAICAIHHGLDALEFDRDRLLSREGLARTRWLLEPSAPTLAYDWIYRWLYLDHVNGGHYTLSRQHGAELLKISLLRRFLLAGGSAEDTVRKASLKPFLVRSQILQGLVHSALRNCDDQLAAKSLEQLDELLSLARSAIEDPTFLGDAIRQRSWLQQLVGVEREVSKLRLDGAVMFNLKFSKVPQQQSPRRRNSVRVIVEALRGAAGGGFNSYALTRQVRHIIRENRAREVPFVNLPEAARQLRQDLPRATVQSLYDFLLRYAQLLANFADFHDDLPKRTSRQKSALVAFELAEALRRGGGGDQSEHVLSLSARPVRNASRLCLAIGKAMHSEEARRGVKIEDQCDAQWCLERAAYYAFHFIGHHSRYQVERAAALIIQASTIRMRSQLINKPKLEVAMRVLKTAEQALIHYPDRRQLWMRFYLERARLFRDRALQLGAAHVDTSLCSAYCRADAASVIRLANEREYWVKRAERVIAGLSDSVEQPATLIPPPPEPRTHC